MQHWKHRARFGVLLLCAALTMMPASAQPKVEEARIDMANGVPRLTINGKPTAPLMFFPNTDIPGEWSKTFLTQQVTLAGRAGVHLYSHPFRVERDAQGNADYTRAMNDMQRVVDADPEALFLLRMFPGPWPFWKEWKDIPSSHVAAFADGSTGFISIASPYFWAFSNERFGETIRYVEEHPLGARVIGYHAGGPEHEMFMDKYRSNGPDYSPINQARFREWLSEKYGTDEALQAAWGREDITLETAELPKPEEGRFPMRGIRDEETARIFYERPQEQAWVDYGLYGSSIVSERILDWARFIKEETGGKKLTAFFYGYTTELCGSFSGHCELNRVLADPNVDILASPYSYMGRLAGEPGGFMCPVDSITAHGKLWFNENDSRTSVLDADKVPENVSLWIGDKAADLDETLAMLGRNLGGEFVHRAGTWWMDLLGGGAFNHRALWEMMEARAPLYQGIYADPTPYRPDVAILVDESSKALFRSDWDANYQLLIHLRNESMKSGAAVGFYALEDFISGVTPACKVYVFANAFALSSAEREAITERLKQEEAAALWAYAPNVWGEDGADLGRVEAMTGIAAKASAGRQGSTGQGLLAGLTWGWPERVEPRPVLSGDAGKVIGVYQSGGQPSAVVTEAPGFKSYYFGSLALSADVLRTVFEDAGAHIWTRENEVVHCDGRLLIVHRAASGPVTIHLPEGFSAEAITKVTAVEKGPREVMALFEKNDTHWFKLSH